MNDPERDKALEEIAKELLEIPSLVLTNKLARTPSSLPIVDIKQALQLAYKAGEESQDSKLWLEFIRGGNCGLCANSGVIDTRGPIITGTVVVPRTKGYCICPNGRALKLRGVDIHDT